MDQKKADDIAKELEAFLAYTQTLRNVSDPVVHDYLVAHSQLLARIRDLLRGR